ncbi:uncharacterized protein B0H18DRAFT_686378 [Fomitopsis serialis]|uniref:uncharacterized protein n=1 Tax=Fomitopsis serialis TaxID=139415 RepID=UPI002007CD55|nr:uncharacterized protein B0H18DRAFT_686378 [Neoantrodia serialis]KAH9917812.1 hypothetical protein B0H18DRAFT_686378 [Neoantrodia serialis]
MLPCLWLLLFLLEAVAFVGILKTLEYANLKAEWQRILDRSAPIFLLEKPTFNIYFLSKDVVYENPGPAPESSVAYPPGFFLEHQYSALPEFDHAVQPDSPVASNLRSAPTWLSEWRGIIELIVIGSIITVCIVIVGKMILKLGLQRQRMVLEERARERQRVREQRRAGPLRVRTRSGEPLPLQDSHVRVERVAPAEASRAG